MPAKTPDIPEGREHEFLTDAQLAEHFAQKAAKAKGDDKSEIEAKAARAKLAALTTASVQAAATDPGE